MGEMEENTSQPGFDDAPVVTEVAVVQDDAALDAIAADLEVAEPSEPVDETEVDELAALTASLDTDEAIAGESVPEAEPAPEAESVPVSEAEAAPLEPSTSDTESPDEDATTSFDAIPVVSVQPSPEAAAVSLPPSVPWWPFLAYLGAWIVLAGVAVWQLMQLPAASVAYESPAYALMILGGLTMTAVGPVLILAVWLAVRAGRPAGNRAGLLTSSLLKGALVTLSGAIIWWAALVIVDVVRLGSPL